jgi:hypothetical protein
MLSCLQLFDVGHVLQQGRLPEGGLDPRSRRHLAEFFEIAKKLKASAWKEDSAPTGLLDPAENFSAWHNQALAQEQRLRRLDNQSCSTPRSPSALPDDVRPFQGQGLHLRRP